MASIFTGVIVFMLVVVAPPVFAEDITIICNKSVMESSVTGDDLKKIFTGDKTRWDDNSMVVLALQKNKDVSRSFLEKYVGMTTKTYQRYLKKKIYTGGFKQPKAFKTESEIIKFVAATKGAVGYVVSEPSNWDTWLIKPLLIE